MKNNIEKLLSDLDYLDKVKIKLGFNNHYQDIISVRYFLPLMAGVLFFIAGPVLVYFYGPESGFFGFLTWVFSIVACFIAVVGLAVIIASLSNNELIIYNNAKNYMDKKLTSSEISVLANITCSNFLSFSDVKDAKRTISSKKSEILNNLKTKECLLEFAEMLEEDKEKFKQYVDLFSELLEDYNEEQEEKKEQIEKLNEGLSKLGGNKFSVEEPIKLSIKESEDI